jgi:hypothetical protein
MDFGLLGSIYAILSLIFTPILFGICLILVYLNDEWRAKIGNLMNKSKNYGIIDVAERGNKISSHIVPFSETIALIGKRVFIIPAQVRVRNGLPHAYFPYNDAINNITATDPLQRIKNIVLGKKTAPEPDAVKEYSIDDSNFPKPRQKAQDPEVLNAAIMAVKSEAEAEADAKLKQFQMFIYLILLFSFLAVVFGYLTLDKSGAIQGTVNAILSKIPTVIKG